MKDYLLRVLNYDESIVLKTFKFSSLRDCETASDILNFLSSEFGSDDFCIGSRIVVKELNKGRRANK